MRYLFISAIAVCTLIAFSHWRRVRGETNALRIRRASGRARILAGIACLLAFLAPIATVVQTFAAIESLEVERRALALADGISGAMNVALASAIFVAPTVFIALALAKRSRGVHEASGASSAPSSEDGRGASQASLPSPRTNCPAPPVRRDIALSLLCIRVHAAIRTQLGFRTTDAVS